MNGLIPVYDWFFNETSASKEYKNVWTNEFIEKWMRDFSIENVLKRKGPVARFPYGAGAPRSILHALQKYDINGKNVAVIGTIHPWIEAILLNVGNTVTTVEYDPPVSKSFKVKTVKYENEFNTGKPNMYDVIVTFSSVEHSGLGRYGDPLDPDGDLKVMDDAYRVLKHDGLLLFGAPMGKDALVWNAHRIYGTYS